MLAHLHRARLALLAATAAIAITACGSGAATSGPGGPAATAAGGDSATQAPGGGAATRQPGGGPTTDACALLTDDDIKAVTGYAVAKKTPGQQGGIFVDGCLWDLTAPSEIVPPSIALGIMTTGGKAYYDAYFKPYNEEQGNTLIPGLGDEVVDAGFGVIQGIKGDAFFNLQYLGESDLELDLAKRLVANL